MKKFFYNSLLAIIIITALTFGFFYGSRNQHSPDYLTAKISSNEDVFLTTDLPVSEWKGVFEQPFFYKGQGCTSCAFESADGRFILKFFKNRKDKGEDYLKKRLAGYHLASEVHQRESGILVWHPWKTQCKKLLSAIIYPNEKDAEPMPFSPILLNLNDYIFVLQVKVNTLSCVLQEALKQGDPQKARDFLQKAFSLYRNEGKKNLFDGDSKFLFNTGFCEGSLIRFDVSHLKRYEKKEKAQKQ